MLSFIFSCERALMFSFRVFVSIFDPLDRLAERAHLSGYSGVVFVWVGPVLGH